MDPLKLRPLGLMILALLREGDMHPYEMMRLLRARRDDRLVRIQNGTFYHQVAALERDGCIAELGVDRDGGRPERTTYTLLPAGREATTDWVRDRLGRFDRTADFQVALAEAHNLPRDEFAELTRARLAWLRARRDEGRVAVDAALARGVEPQFLIEAERALALATADIEWTERMLVHLAEPDYAWVCSAAWNHATGSDGGPTPHAEQQRAAE